MATKVSHNGLRIALHLDAVEHDVLTGEDVIKALDVSREGARAGLRDLVDNDVLRIVEPADRTLAAAYALRDGDDVDDVRAYAPGATLRIRAEMHGRQTHPDGPTDRPRRIATDGGSYE